MGKDIKETKVAFEDGNIFDDFSTEDSLKKEVEEIKNKEKKDAFFYIKMWSAFIGTINAILLMTLGIFFVYTLIQNDEDNSDYSIFTPICNIFLWDVAKDIDTCYSVSYYTKQVEKKLEDEKIYQTKEVSSLIGDIYFIENFTHSKAVSFLVNMSKTKLDPMEILSHFDMLKNKFEPVDKSKITCENISIRDSDILEARCYSYSSDWDTKISEVKKWVLSQSKWWGTSISVASSFINFIENYSESRFQVVDKQKIFFTTDVTGKGIYTKRTPFTLMLQYNNSKNINF